MGDRILRVWGLSRDELEALLEPISARAEAGPVFSEAGACAVDARVSIDEAGFEEMCDLLGSNLYSISSKVSIQERLAHDLSRAGLDLSVAESCTGGLLGARLTEVPGASDWFAGGVIAYSNTIKSKLLGVGESLLRKAGAVSSEVGMSMAAAVRSKTGTDLGAAISGVAGPSGAMPGKPVGTVWMAVSSTLGTRAACRLFEGGRENVRESAVCWTMGMLITELGKLVEES